MLNRIKRRLQIVCAYLKQTVRSFLHRLLDEPGYADAVADGFTYAAQLCCRNWAVVGLIRQVAKTLAALVRDAIRNRQRDNELPWEFA